jgi:cytokinesis protein
MTSIFGRKKTKEDRPRQVSTELQERSVPYDRVAGGRPPVPISAPITNPTLTSDGTELNVHAINRARAERDRIYGRGPARPASPTTSSSTNESSTLYDGTSASSSSTLASNAARKSAGRRARQSDGSAISGPETPLRSPNFPAEFAPMPSPKFGTPRPQPTSRDRPTSVATSRSESNRSSRYSASLAPSDRHLSNGYHLRSNQDNFNFPRPSDSDIVEMFEQVRRRRDMPGSDNFNLEQKWQMVYNDEHTRWQEAQKGAVGRGRVYEGNDSVPTQTLEGTPMWYIKKFMEKTINHKQAQGLAVSLRSNDLGYVPLPCLIV